mgnify:CR=1 FL=1
MEALETALGALEPARAYTRMIPLCQRLLQLEPCHEAAARRLMHAHALTGDRAAALRTFTAFQKCLAEEFGLEPEPTFQEAFDRLKQAGTVVPISPKAGPPLVGRQVEWARLLDAWQQARQGQPQCVVLTGEPGVGKSRLAEELSSHLKAQGGWVAHARCSPAETVLVLSTVTELVRELLPPDLPPVWGSELSRILPEMLERHPGLPPPPLVEPWQQLRFFQTLVRVLLHRQPLLLVIDDLQWCDAESLRVLLRLFRETAPPRLLLLATLREEDVSPESALSTLFLPTLRMGRCLTSLEIESLDVEHAARDEVA